MADDHPTFRMGLRAVLAAIPNAQIAEAATGAQAVEAAARTPPDVVIMDLQMPQMSGVEAASRILAICPLPPAHEPRTRGARPHRGR